MQNSLAEEHPELFHYTNAAGLAGIIQSQTLWATHFAYLNDSEEIRFFIKDRLTKYLETISEDYINEQIQQDQNVLSRIELMGGKDKVVKQFVQETLTAHENLFFNNKFAEPYITSFCTSKDLDCKVKDHGLLSQWRSYGRDGGYAVVFDTTDLLNLLKKIGNKWKNGIYLFIGDVVYSSDPDTRFHDEFKNDLDVIKKFIFNHLRNIGDKKNKEIIYSALLRCMSRYKHWGFKEENEVRIIASPFPIHQSQFQEDMKADGIVISKIPQKHYLRYGTLVPYIDLFEGIPCSSGKRLPITRIIVGPAANAEERKKRVRSVEILLDQYTIEGVTVSASDIPYIG